MSADPAFGGASVLSPPGRRRRRAEPPPPPEPPGDREGGDGSGDGGASRPVFPGGAPEGARLLGLVLALVGIATLFAVFLAAWLFLQRREPDAARASPLVPPNALWISTLVLAASSFTIERAARARPRAAAVVRWLLASLLLGLSFLGAQATLWWILLRGGIVPSSGAYGAIFFALTGLHGLHVLGGLGCMAFATTRALGARLGPGTLRLCAIYWHFMGALWIVLFSVLYFVR